MRPNLLQCGVAATLLSGCGAPPALVPGYRVLLPGAEESAPTTDSEPEEEVGKSPNPGPPEVIRGVLAASDDRDGDGYRAASDCDDTDPAVHPGAVDVCDDGMDADCDGSAATCRLDGEVTLDVADETQLGSVEGGELGCGIALLARGAGRGVLAVSAPGDSPNGSHVGIVHLYDDVGGVPLEDADPVASILGGGVEDWFGANLAREIDLDRDGYGDLGVGVTQADHDSWGEDAGGAHFFLGPVTGSLHMGDADLVVWGTVPSGHAGRSMDAEDLDRDGVVDLVIGANRAEFGGAAYLLLGPLSGAVSVDSASIKIRGESDNAWAGSVVAVLQDLDGDGFPEIGVSAYGESAICSHCGRVGLWTELEPGSYPIGAATRVLEGTEEEGYFGRALANAGDTDGDGYSEIVVTGSMMQATAGRAFLLPGGPGGIFGLATAIAVVTGTTDANLGTSAAAGDLDGDGLSDLALGAPGAESDQGAVALFYGPVSGSHDLSGAELVIRGTTPYQKAGTFVASGRDLDGDGLDDLVVGSPKARIGTLSKAGRVDVFFGRGW